MKARIIKITGLLVAGALVFGAAYTQNRADVTADAAVTAEESTEKTALTAGASRQIADQIEDTISLDSRVAAGATDVIGDYLLSTAAMTEDDLQVAENDTVTTAAGQAEAYGYTNLGIAQVDGNLNVRETPSTEADVVGKMPNNAGCEILEQDGEWTRIKSGKVEGYVSSEYLLSGDAALAKAQEVRQTVATVTTTTLYVREEPNTDSTIITMMPLGEELEVIETLDGWVKINVDSDEGYVSSDYVDISVELAKAQTMTEVRYGQGVSDVRVSLVSYATQFVGNPYVWGGTSLTRGADCSGFVLSVFANYGISLPHSSVAQANCGRKISASEAQPGDLFFYGNGSRINHVAIYIGNGQVVHASSPKSGIKISGAFYRTPVKVVRVINN
mgnify:FL=1